MNSDRSPHVAVNGAARVPIPAATEAFVQIWLPDTLDPVIAGRSGLVGASMSSTIVVPIWNASSACIIA